MSLKILLITPPMSREERYGSYSDAGSTAPPLGILYVAAVMEGNDYTVQVIDGMKGDITQADVIKEVKSFDPDIVGISVTTISFHRTIEISKEIRKISRDILIVMGGPDVSARKENYKKYIADNVCDCAVYGEGEETMSELAEAFLNGHAFSEIKGLIYANKDEVVVNPPRAYIKDLDALPLPARHLLDDMEDYRCHLFTYKRRPWTTMITSRGCPYKCVFCDRSVFGNKYRVRSAENIFQEMKVLHDKYGIKEIAIYDDTFTIQKSRLENLFDMLIEADMDLIWSCSARVDTLTYDIIRKMKKAGCWLISIGIESGDEEVLRRIRKGITLQQVRNVVTWASRTGLMIKGFFIIGHPGETRETIIKTIDFARSLDLYTVNFCTTYLLPGTELTRTASKYGFVNIHGFSNMSGHTDKLSFVPFNLTEDELKGWQKKAYLLFYLRPKVVIKIFFGNKTISDLKSFIPKVLISIKFLWKFMWR
ncbi:MAG: radical SAM protein [Planctomycetes bacterium]|nr:radical SAM protein [Planctomycetota bacterium]